MDAEMLTVAEIDRRRVGVEGRRGELAVGADNCALDGSLRQQRYVTSPGVNVELAMRSAHAFSDDLHSAGNSVKDVIYFVGKGDGEITAFGSRTVHRRFSRREDRRDDNCPDRHYHNGGDRNDTQSKNPAATVGVFGPRGKQNPHAPNRMRQSSTAMLIIGL